MINRFDARSLMTGSLMLLKYFGIIYLVSTLKPEGFKELQTALSLCAFSVFFIPAFFVSLKREFLNQIKKNRLRINYYLGLYSFVICSFYALLIAISVFLDYLYSVVIIITTLRLLSFQFEFILEVVGFKYTLLPAIVAEVIILISLSSFDISYYILFLFSLIFFIFFFAKFKPIAKYSSVKKVFKIQNLHAYKLELSSGLLFALEIYWASKFMNADQFSFYYLISRVFLNLIVFYGIKTRDIWTTGFLDNDFGRIKLLSKYSLIGNKIRIFGISLTFLVFILYFISYEFINEFIIELDVNSFILITLSEFLFFIIRSVDRDYKNIISSRNNIFDISTSQLVFAILFTLFLMLSSFYTTLIYFYLIQKVIFFFFNNLYIRHKYL